MRRANSLLTTLIHLERLFCAESTINYAGMGLFLKPHLDIIKPNTYICDYSALWSNERSHDSGKSKCRRVQSLPLSFKFSCLVAFQVRLTHQLPAKHAYVNNHTLDCTDTKVLGRTQIKHDGKFKEACIVQLRQRHNKQTC